jgi:thymidine kinase
MGPMFSGKSSYLLSSIRKYKEIGWPVFIITSSFDKRYSDSANIVNHNRDSCKADVAVKNLSDVCSKQDYLEAKVIIIEEAQFYPDLVEFVKEAVEVYEKHVIVAGLDGDAQRKPFGDLLELIPLADTIVKLKAMCKICNDGTEALFTSKKVHDTSVIDVGKINNCTHINNSVINVGGADKYEALCRKHYIAYN